MRKVVAAAFVSLDGVMQAPGAPQEDPTGGFTLGGWTATYWDEMMGAAMDETFATPFDLLLGRKTYDIFAAHWPYLETDPVGAAFNGCTKYVATRSDRALPWRNTVALRGDVTAEVARLKGTHGPQLLTQGSSELLQALMAHQLIDEFRLMVFPVVLGSGKRLFGSGASPSGLTLVDSQVSSTGVVVSTYRPAGEIVTGSFALEPPTEAELQRRADLAKDG